MESFGNSLLGILLAAVILVAAIKPDRVGEWIVEVEQARAVLAEQEKDDE